jgi:DNA invertase Pin-like site-specific DNA recombinase
MVLLHPINVQSDHGQKSFLGRNLWTGSAQLAGAHGSRPQNGRFGDAMGDILGYARVSTGDQDIAGQTVRLVAAGAIRIFSDVRSGRSIMDRPGLDALLACAVGLCAQRGYVGRVVRLDRLGRSLSELLATVAALKERGIALFSLEENINTASAAGELVFHVFAVIAHFERRLIAERTKDGIIAARARGKHPGRHPLDPDKVAAAIQLVKAGLSPTVIARQLGLGRSTVYREIKRAGVERGEQAISIACS